MKVILLRREIEVLQIDDFHDLVIAVIQLQVIAAGYARIELDQPKWFAEKLRDAEAELKHRTRAQKERKLEELKMRQEHLKTRHEQREDVDDELKRLEAELAG